MVAKLGYVGRGRHIFLHVHPMSACKVGVLQLQILRLSIHHLVELLEALADFLFPFRLGLLLSRLLLAFILVLFLWFNIIFDCLVAILLLFFLLFFGVHVALVLCLEQVGHRGVSYVLG